MVRLLTSFLLCGLMAAALSLQGQTLSSEEREGFADFKRYYLRRFPTKNTTDIEAAYDRAKALLQRAQKAASILVTLSAKVEQEGKPSFGDASALSFTAGMGRFAGNIQLGWGWSRYSWGRRFHVSAGGLRGLRGYGISAAWVDASWRVGVDGEPFVILPQELKGDYFVRFFEEGSAIGQSMTGATSASVSVGDDKPLDATSATLVGSAFGLSTFRATTIRQRAWALPFHRMSPAGHAYLAALKVQDQVFAEFMRLLFERLEGKDRKPWEERQRPGTLEVFEAAVKALQKAVTDFFRKASESSDTTSDLHAESETLDVAVLQSDSAPSEPRSSDAPPSTTAEAVVGAASPDLGRFQSMTSLYGDAAGVSIAGSPFYRLYPYLKACARRLAFMARGH